MSQSHTIVVGCTSCQWTASAKPGDLVAITQTTENRCVEHKVVAS